MHLWDLQIQQKQSLGGFGQPRHFSKDRSIQTLFLTLSCFHCSPDYQRKPYNQEDSLCEEDLGEKKIKKSNTYIIQKSWINTITGIYLCLQHNRVVLVFTYTISKTKHKMVSTDRNDVALRINIGKP